MENNKINSETRLLGLLEEIKSLINTTNRIIGALYKLIDNRINND